jgi:hypothetical protein
MNVLAWLMVFPILEFAYIDSANINGYELPEHSTEITIGAEAVAFDLLYVKGGSTSYQQYQDIDVWAPYLTDYKFEAGVRYNGFEVGYYHECRHRVISEAYLPYQFGGMTKYFIRYGGTL